MTNETCGVHRLSLTILALKRRLERDRLDSEERDMIEREIARLEKELGID